MTATAGPQVRLVRRRVRRTAAFLMLIAAVALTVASVLVGSHVVAVAEVWESFRAFNRSQPDHVVVRILRVPRTAAALLVGVALGAAGTLTQGLTRNPMVEPGLLGVNAGAAAGVAVATVVAGGTLNPVLTMVVAFTGSAAAGAAALLLGGVFSGRADRIRLVLAGAALSSTLAAITSVVILSYPRTFEEFRHWDAGALTARPWPLLGLALVVISVGLVLAWVASRALDALALGDEMGVTVGASPVRTWLVAGTAVVLLSGAATAVAGPISFLGLAAPLMSRALRATRTGEVLVSSAVLATVILLTADVAGRVVVRPFEVHAGLAVGLIGAPVFLVMAARKIST